MEHAYLKDQLRSHGLSIIVPEQPVRADAPLSLLWTIPCVYKHP